MQASKPCAGYSADTEVLTRSRSWLRFDQITIADEVAARAPDGEFRWEHPRRVIWQHYAGNMVGLHARSLDVLAAPNQPILWSPEGGARKLARIDPASHLLSRGQFVARKRGTGCLLATSSYDAPDLLGKMFIGVRRTKMGPKPLDVAMTGDQFAAFMGMYTAEGSATHTENSRDWLISIAQTQGGKGWDEYRDLLTEIYGRTPGGTYKSFALHSRALYEYLKPLGNARTKYLPQDVLDLSRRQLEIFWRFYALGDGSTERHHDRGTDQEVAATASPLLAGQLQEIIQKLGCSTSVRHVLQKANHLVRSSNWICKLRVRRTALPAFASSAVPYTGMIGGVQVPSGVIYVRRNGHPIWSGSA